MRQLFVLAAFCVVLTFAAYGFQGRGARGQAPAPARPSMPRCGEACRAAIEIPSTTTSFSF
jgi:hypothetical protein